MIVRVEVTEADVREGVPTDACRCAVARAVSREIGVDVTVTERLLLLNGSHAEVELPSAAQRFVERFDSGPACTACDDDVDAREDCRRCHGSGLEHNPEATPFSFDLVVPDSALPRGYVEARRTS